LTALVEQFESAFAACDYLRAADLLERDFVAMWFGLGPARLAEVLAVVAQQNVPNRGFITLLNYAVFSAPTVDLDRLSAELGTERAKLLSGLKEISDIFKLRFSGHPVQALKLALAIEPPTSFTNQTFDRSQGYGLFATVQTGITAMYAGDFAAAIRKFTEARTMFVSDELRFLRRDAIVKTALIEVIYGDPQRAEALLTEADEIERAGSWVEDEIDVACTIIRSQLDGVAGDEQLALLDSVPLHFMGELWPFYVIAVQRSLLGAGRDDEARARVETFAELQLTQTEGEGFTGSALPLAGVINAMQFENLMSAREHLERADPDIAVTGAMSAALELASGRPRQALRMAVRLRAVTKDLRKLELYRLAVIAGAHLTLKQDDDCRDILTHVLQRPGGVRAAELTFFPNEVRQFAEQHVEGWPVAPEVGAWVGYGRLLERRTALTPREIEILRELAGGSSRETIARAQFISVNTLKAHLRAIYRKLDVRSRTAAVLEAERRGYLSG